MLLHRKDFSWEGEKIKNRFDMCQRKFFDISFSYPPFLLRGTVVCAGGGEEKW